MKLKIRFIFAVLILLAGCSKDFSYDTTYVIKPLSQLLPHRAYLPLEGVQAFTYPVDTLLWGVASYEDALSGVITLKTDPTQKMTTPEATSTPYQEIEGTIGWIQLPTSAPMQMIVAVDPDSKVYAYTQREQVVDLPRVVAVLRFMKWKEGFSYKDGPWSFYNKFYTPASKVVCSILPRIQATEGGAEEPITTASRIKAYAYAVDTTEWRLASYTDASNGLITSKSDPKQTISSPDYSAYYDTPTQHWNLSATISPLMVVVVDTQTKRYAYSQQQFPIPGDPVTFNPVVFRTWTGPGVVVEQGWTQVNEGLMPKTAVKTIKP